MSDEKKTETKAPDELEQQIDKLILTKTGYERNRNLTACVVVLLGYYIFSGIRDGDGTWWFYLLMAAMFLVAGFILYRSWKTTKELNQQIDALQAEKHARDDAAAEAEAAEDAAFIEAAASDATTSADKASDATTSASESAADNQASDADKAEGASASSEAESEDKASDADKA